MDNRHLLLEARAVTRAYGTNGAVVVAVSDVSCKVFEGDRIALVGPSGSGKSTLMYLLAGLEAPSSGSIAWPALNPPGPLMPAFAGFVFQFPNLLPPLTAAENVAVPLLIAGVSPSQADAAARSALARLDLLDVADRSAEDLSAGQAERVGIARALIADPSIVFADEPTGQLDGLTAARVIDGLLAAADRKRAALIVATHDERIASRFGVRWTMDHGALKTLTP